MRISLDQKIEKAFMEVFFDRNMTLFVLELQIRNI